MNDTGIPNSALAAFATVCTEAARRHGDDFSAVRRQIKAYVDGLPEDQRALLAGEMVRVLRYRAPDSGSPTQ